MIAEAKINNSVENFFLANSAINEYKATSCAIKQAQMPPKKKVYRSMEKILKECYLIGSLKYGNNFIV